MQLLNIIAKQILFQIDRLKSLICAFQKLALLSGNHTSMLVALSSRYPDRAHASRVAEAPRGSA
jgi:hypothetical protein